MVTARLFIGYGPDQKDQKKLIPYVTRSLLRSEVPLLMSGTRECGWIYVDDVVDAYLALAATPGIKDSTIDVGTGGIDIGTRRGDETDRHPRSGCPAIFRQRQ